MLPAMIISTSSHNVQLTDDICEYVEETLRNEFGHVSDRVTSIDARLEAIHGTRDRYDIKAVVRVDLRNREALVTEVQDKDLHAAVRRGAADSARAFGRQARHSRELSGQRSPGMFHAFSRYSASNI